METPTKPTSHRSSIIRRPERTIRLPLQVGMTAMWSLARAALAIVPAPAIFIAGLTFMFTSHGIGGLFCLILGGLLGVFTGFHIIRTRQDRPSDVVLTPEGLCIEGGPFAGRLLSWEKINGRACRVESIKEDRLTLGSIIGSAFFMVLMAVLRIDVSESSKGTKRDLWRLHVVLGNDDEASANGGGHGLDLVVAEAERPVEKESLEALIDSIRNVYGLPPSKLRSNTPAIPTVPVRAVDLFVCPECQAPIAPVDAAMAVCRYCKAQAPVPQGLRDRLAAHEKAAAQHAESEKMLLQLLEQPGAHVANRRLALLGVMMGLVWLIVVVLEIVRSVKGSIDGADIVLCVPIAFGGIVALATVGRALLVNRLALRVITIGLGARLPERPGDPYRCRRCAAPLPEKTGMLVVHCAYCESENVLGLDVRDEVAREGAQEMSLEETFTMRRRQRRTWGLLSAGAGLWLLFAMVIGIGLAMEGSGKTGTSRSLAMRAVVACDSGNLQECLSACRLYPREERAKGAVYCQRACDAKLGEGCCLLADGFIPGFSDEIESRRVALYDLACQAGYAKGCDELAGDLEHGRGVARDRVRARVLYDRACKGGYQEACLKGK